MSDDEWIYDRLRDTVDDIASAVGRGEDINWSDLRHLIDEAEADAEVAISVATDAQGEAYALRSSLKNEVPAAVRAIDQVMDVVPDMLPRHMGQVDDRWAREALEGLGQSRAALADICVYRDL